MTKVIRYTLKDITYYVLSCNEHPNIIAFHYQRSKNNGAPSVCSKPLTPYCGSQTKMERR